MRMGMTLEEKIEDILREDLVLSTDAGQPYIKFDDVAIDKIFDLIKEETVRARIDELKRLWNSTQPDLVPQGAEPNDMSEELHGRIPQLQAELEGLK